MCHTCFSQSVSLTTFGRQNVGLGYYWIQCNYEINLFYITTARIEDIQSIEQHVLDTYAGKQLS